MTKITIDATLRDRLQKVHGPAELCDESGRVLGRFVPAPVELRDESGRVPSQFVPSVVDLTEWEPVTPDVSEEELDRREQEAEFFTTAEMLAYLETLKCSESDGNGPPSTN